MQPPPFGSRNSDFHDGLPWSGQQYVVKDRRLQRPSTSITPRIIDGEGARDPLSICNGNGKLLAEARRILRSKISESTPQDDMSVAPLADTFELREVVGIYIYIYIYV